MSYKSNDNQHAARPGNPVASQTEAPGAVDRSGGVPNIYADQGPGFAAAPWPAAATSGTAPAVNPPRWSGKKTAIAAALALGLGGATAVTAAAVSPAQEVSQTQRGPGGAGGQDGMRRGGPGFGQPGGAWQPGGPMTGQNGQSQNGQSQNGQFGTGGAPGMMDDD